ncbi:MAG: hypothetical protein H6816_16005 [Phycisphaerales bacterium]|nr:hypothetical protein [Phycisphaerales bacterium]
MQQPFGSPESERSVGPEGEGARGTTPSWDPDFPEAVPFGEFYARLRAIAEALLRRERPDHTLQTTELVHEAYLRMGDHPAVRSGPKALLYAIASKVLRDVLVDHARRRGQVKRGAGWRRVALEVAETSRAAPSRTYDLDDALVRLAAMSGSRRSSRCGSSAA